MTEHLTFVLDKNFKSDYHNKYICIEDINCIIYIPHTISQKNNNIIKEKIRISISSIN
jgi:hypothetical protein